MNLTAAQRKRLAREARKLAMECVDGRAVIGRWYTAGRDCPACVIGQLSERIGMGLDDMTNDVVVGEYDVIFSASIYGKPAFEFSFAILALADALDPTLDPTP